MAINGLTSGRHIEVLWEITERNRKRKVWWSAVVLSIARPLRPDGNSSAILLYAPMLGHKATKSKVRFLSESELDTTELGARRIRQNWRWGIDNNSEAGRSPVAQRTTSDSEPDRHSHVLRTELIEKDTVQMQGITPEQYEHLVSRVDELEKTVRGNANSQQVHAFSSNEIGARPLIFARQKIGIELQRALHGTTRLIRMYQDAHCVAQDSISVEVDCTLTEFEGICQLASKVDESGVVFSPKYPSMNSSKIPPSYRIEFESYALMCKVLGVTCLDDISETVKKTKLDRRTGAPTMLRIIGVLAQDTTSESGAVALAVASSILPFPEIQRSVSVLFRRTQRWDPVDGIFADKLVTRAMTVQDLAGILQSGDCTTSEADVEGPACPETVFRMTWKRTSKHLEGPFDGSRQETVLGMVEVFIPCVLFRGQVLCSEVETLCSDVFIKTVIS